MQRVVVLERAGSFERVRELLIGQLANVISDLSGWTGMRIVRAILAGERDPHALAALSHPGIHATRDTIAKSLEGTWQPELLFVLQQEITMYDA
jgi:transposase